MVHRALGLEPFDFLFSPYNGPTDSQNIETENIEVEESHNDPTIKDIMKQSEHLEKVFFDSKKRVDLETDSVELDPVMLEAISTLTHARSVSVISQHILFNSIFTVDHEKKEGTCRLCKSKPIELRDLQTSEWEPRRNCQGGSVTLRRFFSDTWEKIHTEEQCLKRTRQMKNSNRYKMTYEST